MTIDIKKKIIINGVRQRIHIVSEDIQKPVLLFLHGGPGVPNRHSILTQHRDLLDTFTIVTWDQRGTGGSYYDVPEESLTIKQITEDAKELVRYLCYEFKKDKIFVIGGSWGSELGVWLSYRYPEHIAAFVGFGQVVNIAKNEELSYEFTLEQAKMAGNEEDIKDLESVGPPVMGVYKGGFDGMMTQRQIMMKYGGYSKDEGKRSYFDAMVKPILASGEYDPQDLVGYLLGYKRVLKAMWNEVGETDFPTTCTKFQIPVFIFDGRLDMNTPSVLVEDWFNMIEAPRKELIWFEESGHNPMGDEPEKFKKLLRDRLMEVKESETCRI